MRVTRAYLAGFGTAGSLLAGASLLFVMATALVAYRGWPRVADAGPQPALVLAQAPEYGVSAAAVGARRAAGPAHAGSRGNAVVGSHAPAHQTVAGIAHRASVLTTLVPTAPRRALHHQTPSTSTPTLPHPDVPTCTTCGAPPTPTAALGGVATTTAGSVGTGVSSAGQQVGNTVSGLTGALGSQLSQANPAVGGLVTGVGQALGQAVTQATGAAGGAVTGTGQLLGGLLSGLGATQ
jgi:hypothetical protein